MAMSERDYRVRNSSLDSVSLCIPRIHKNINGKRIQYVFNKLGWGRVLRVDVCPLRNNTRFNIGYIHFSAWNTQSNHAMDVLNALKEQQEVKVYYEDDKPWFWKLSISKARRPTQRSNHERRFKISIGNAMPTPPSSPTNPRGLDNTPAWQNVDRHDDVPKDTDNSVSYGRAKPKHPKITKIKNNDKRNAEGLAGFFAAAEKRRTYESACELAYANKESLPESFVLPEDDASEDIKRAFIRAVYTHLGM